MIRGDMPARRRRADRRPRAGDNKEETRWQTTIATPDPNIDFADFAKGGLTYATQADGRIDSLPLNLDPWVVYYNKELFDAKGIAYPKDFAAMIDAAAKLNDPAKGISGFVARGLKNA